MSILNPDLIKTSDSTKAFRGMFWAFLFISFDFSFGINDVYFDVLPDFIGWFIAFLSMRRLIPVHREAQSLKNISAWLILLSLFSFIEIRIPFKQVMNMTYWYTPFYFLNSIPQFLEIIFVWSLFGVIRDMASAETTNFPQIAEMAKSRRVLYIAFDCAAIVIGLAAFNYQFFSPPIPSLLIASICLLFLVFLTMGLMKAAEKMCDGRLEPSSPFHFSQQIRFIAWCAFLTVLLAVSIISMWKSSYKPKKDLWQAIAYGDVEEIKKHIRYGTDFNYWPPNMRFVHSPLRTAINQDQAEIAKLLIENGARVDEWDSFEEPILLCAIRHKLDGLVEFMIKNGADINIRDTFGHTTALHYAIMYQDNLVPFLLQNNARVTSRNSSNQTPLHYAAYYANTKIVKLLLEKKADPNAVDDSGRTPLFYALDYRENYDVLETLIDAGAKVNVKADLRRPLIKWYGNNGTTELYCPPSFSKMEGMDPSGWTPLHYAAAKGDEKLVIFLLDKGADPNLTDASNRTPADCAKLKGHEKIAELLESKMKPSEN